MLRVLDQGVFEITVCYVENLACHFHLDVDVEVEDSGRRQTVSVHNLTSLVSFKLDTIWHREREAAINVVPPVYLLFWGLF